MDSDNVAALDDMLQACVAYGTGKKAALGIHVAGKTGTTQDYRDAWFIGYAGRLTTGIWMGNDDNTEMKKITGGNLPAQLWHDYMLVATGHDNADKDDKDDSKDSEQPAYTKEQASGFSKFLDGLFGDKVTVEPNYPERR
jgi:penicillin-binding protein 1A